MSESSYVELPVIAWLSGHGRPTPGNQGLGWTYRDESAMGPSRVVNGVQDLKAILRANGRSSPRSAF